MKAIIGSVFAAMFFLLVHDSATASSTCSVTGSSSQFKLIIDGEIYDSYTDVGVLIADGNDEGCNWDRTVCELQADIQYAKDQNNETDEVSASRISLEGTINSGWKYRCGPSSRVHRCNSNTGRFSPRLRSCMD